MQPTAADRAVFAGPQVELMEEMAQTAPVFCCVGGFS
jgi:hypothetical protein